MTRLRVTTATHSRCRARLRQGGRLAARYVMAFPFRSYVNGTCSIAEAVNAVVPATQSPPFPQAGMTSDNACSRKLPGPSRSSRKCSTDEVVVGTPV